MQSHTTHVQSHHNPMISHARNERLEALRARHEKLDKNLRKQQLSLSASDQDVRKTKSEKLRIKDEIEYLKSVS